jgi:hypothetical protein
MIQKSFYWPWGGFNDLQEDIGAGMCRQPWWQVAGTLWWMLRISKVIALVGPLELCGIEELRFEHLLTEVPSCYYRKHKEFSVALQAR